MELTSELQCLAEGFVSSSFFESSSRRTLTCSQQSPSPSVTDDLHELLNQLGLIKYIDVFEQQEVSLCTENWPWSTRTLSGWVMHSEWLSLWQIDYQTFLTLSDDDLKEVGVSTFGARRKMLLAISGENHSWYHLDIYCALCSCHVIWFDCLSRPQQEQKEAVRCTGSKVRLFGGRCERSAPSNHRCGCCSSA